MERLLELSSEVGRVLVHVEIRREPGPVIGAIRDRDVHPAGVRDAGLQRDDLLPAAQAHLDRPDGFLSTSGTADPSSFREPSGPDGALSRCTRTR